mmetsp:Transcript_70758/g.124820  ORF Transcript_70758/g.124820 Transcript_70758/m.124820 type:complete len:976 (-) Transcript_70758:33-2960(-)|eukprot:CAMPEP_0197658764 /NCGR_PEP_ID=MMETSP1338-20131121/45426_1 /TAXON_ID=43686 ORGANISM="Pelagodinium beii, Strain RCC1491" /NCGR_SAMPLE_ID=MMETSP1338 /ASSEMBLY_ACC=CAM_ASM_000754 /LENGTH=975 /DNA_ID=CAMNT_0043235403 /DNA_START=116 /DNA_END=3043 /DNA_ORIENTATION=-
MQIFHQVLELILSLSSELLIFATAFVLQYLIFGDAFGGIWRAKRKHKVQKKIASDEHLEDATVRVANGYENSDSRALLRYWRSLRQDSKVSARLVFQVVEAMQHLKLDTHTILADIQDVLLNASQDINTRYMNEVLGPLARSQHVDLVNGLLELFPELHIKEDSLTYEILVQMNFSMRNFQEVKRLGEEMVSECKAPSFKTSLNLLKASLHSSSLDESIRHFHTMPAATIPQYVSKQLIELACQERRAEDVVAAMEAAKLKLTVEMLNLLLAECLRSRNATLLEQVERLGEEKNSRSYGLLIRAAGTDSEKVSRLLEEAASDKFGEGVISLPVAQAVLATCVETQDLDLVTKLTSLLKPHDPSQVPAILSIIRFHADAGHADKACEIYDRFLCDDRSEQGRRQRAPMDARTKCSLFAAAQAAGRYDITAAVDCGTDWQNAMMWNCNKNKDADGAAKLLEGNSKLPARTWNIALDTCAESDDLPKAKSIMQRMTTEGVADVVSYNTLVKAHIRAGDINSALDTLQEMRKNSCTPPNSVTYNEIIGALLRHDHGKHRKVWDLIAEMKLERLKPSKQILSLLLRELKPKSNNSDVQRVMQLCDEVSGEVDEDFLCSMLNACIKVGKTALVQKTLDMLDGPHGTCISSPRSFGTVIKAYGFVKDLNRAWRYWKTMCSQHIKPTSITIGCMVEAISSNGDVDGAHELIQSLLEQDETRGQVNAVIYGSVLKGFGRAHRMERVWEVFAEMKAYKIEPSLMTFNAIIDGCARNGQMEKVTDLIAEMKSNKLQPNLITQSTMIKGLCATGDMNAAFALFEDIDKGPEAADEAVYNTMLEGCLKASLPDHAEQLMTKMIADGISSSSYTLTVFVKVLSQAKRLEKAFQLTEQASAKFRPRLPSQAQVALLQACIRNRAYEKGAQAYEKFSKQGFAGDAQICQALLRGCSQRRSENSHEAFLQTEAQRLQRDLATVKTPQLKKNF